MASLLACNEKKLGFGFQVFVDHVIGGEGFRPFWLMLPGPRHQLLDGSISLKVLMGTRLESESFEPLIDLLGFQV